MVDLQPRLSPRLTPEGRDWLAGALARIDAEGAAAVPELFPQLPRRLGRDALGGGRQTFGEAVVDLDGWRVCDAGAPVLLGRAGLGGDALLDLYHHGDLEEKTMVLRGAALQPVTEATVQLLGETQRTNTVHHFEAAVCESNLLSRACGHAGFELADFNRALLKLAFLDLPLARVFDVGRHANPELSRMLQGLATEREAAGRAVWRDTNRLIARAPTDGTIARLIGHLEHGDDAHRLAAAEGLGRLRRPDLAPFLRERLPREPREVIRAAIEKALS